MPRCGCQQKCHCKKGRRAPPPGYVRRSATASWNGIETMAEETCTWTGKSGTTYTFYIYDRPPQVPSRAGNFIYARKNSEQLWVPSYISHGNLAKCSEEDLAVMGCIDSSGATHVHMRLCSTEAERIAIHADLLAAYRNTFPPEGCNDPAEAGEG